MDKIELKTKEGRERLFYVFLFSIITSLVSYMIIKSIEARTKR